MKRTLSEEKLPLATPLIDSESPGAFQSGTPDEQTQSELEPVLFNVTPTYSLMEIIDEVNQLSIPTDKHTAPEKSDRSTTASSSTSSNDLLSTLNKAAWSGNVESQFQLGERYLIGEGVDANKEQAFMWFRMAATQGHVAAQVKVEAMYRNGEGVEVDEERALMWCLEAADQGHANSQFNVGVMYQARSGIENKEKAFVYFHKAAEQGDSEAQVCVGIMYRDGVGVEKNNEKAFGWFHKAAEQDDSEAQFYLGVMHRDGVDVEKNTDQAFAWFNKAAVKGYASAQSALGEAYVKGEGVEKNSKKAFEYFQQGALQGNSAAQFNLGLSYAGGEGVKANKEKAFEWFCKAAEQDHHLAQRRVSECYQMGIGVAKDLSMATYWLLKALLSTIDTQKVINLDHHRELIKLFPSILEKYSEFQKITEIKFYSDKAFVGDEEVAAIAEFIRSDSKIHVLNFFPPDNTYDKVISDDQASELAKALKFNTQLTRLKFYGREPSQEITAQIELLLTRNRDIAELRKYVDDLRIETTPGFPLDIVKLMVDKTIVAYLKDGQTKEATKIAIDEMFITAGIKVLESDTQIN